MRRRNSLRLPEYAYDSPGAYFVTVCARDRQCLFGEIVEDGMQLGCVGSIVGACWRRLPERHLGIALDAFVVMPNHVHGIIFLTDRARQASPYMLSSGRSRRAGADSPGGRSGNGPTSSVSSETRWS